MFHGYPYSDFHEANLDWFLNKFKSLLAEWDEMKINFDNIDQAFAALKDYVENYFDNLDVRQEISEKLDQMYEDGTLSGIIEPYYSTHQNLINVLYPPAALDPLDHETDCTNRFINMVNYARGNGFSKIYFPKGTYILMVDSIDLSGLEIYGTIGTIINGYIASINAEHIEDSANNMNSFPFVNNFSIHDFEFSGGNSYANAISIYGLAYKLYNLTIHNYTNKGLRVGAPGGLNSATVGYPLQISVNNVCCYDNVRNNIYINGQSDSTFTDIRCYDTVDRRSVSGSENSMYIDNKTSGCRFFSVHIWGLRDNALVNAGFDNEYYGTHLEGAATKLYMLGRCIFNGQLYDTGENSEPVGVRFGRSIRNAIINILCRNIHTAVVLDGNNGNLNRFLIQSNTNFSGARLFDVNPSRNNFVSAEMYNTVDGTTTYSSVIRDSNTQGGTAENSEYVTRDYYMIGSNNNNLLRIVNSDGDSYPTLVPGSGLCSINANSTLSDADLQLTPKGSGRLRLGAPYTVGEVTPTGYIEVKLTNNRTVQIPVVLV